MVLYLLVHGQRLEARIEATVHAFNRQLVRVTIMCRLGLERIHQVTNTICIAIQGGEYDTYREYTFSQRLN